MYSIIDKNKHPVKNYKVPNVYDVFPKTDLNCLIIRYLVFQTLFSVYETNRTIQSKHTLASYDRKT